MAIVEGLYLLSVTLLAIYGLNSLLHTWIYWRRPVGSDAGSAPLQAELLNRDDCEWPAITVQLPVYNERYVIGRLIAAAVALEWPRSRLQIQILDDSTDDTTEIIAAALVEHAGCGVDLQHIRRASRSGYKAGALQIGMASALGEFVAIFDADFVPPPDFLLRTIPCFADANVACVQTRWGHLNPGTSHLTQAQALGIDGHFVVEQTARARMGAYLNFNGTAGAWRRAAMDDAGGWQGDTLTEDLDLSYRAQLRGWRIAYLPEVVTPAELPVQVDAFKRQQFRWGKGSIQTAIKLGGDLWRAPGPRWRKIAGTLHLTNYAVHPLMLANLLLLLPMSFSHSPLLYLAPILTSTAIGPPIMYWTTMRASGASLPVRIGRLAILVALGTGLSVNNSRAVFEAVTGKSGEFKRTPKFAVTAQPVDWQASSYALPQDPTVWIELLLAGYAASLLVYSAANGIWWMFFWLLLYAGGYGYIASLAFLQARQLHVMRTRLAPQDHGASQKRTVHETGFAGHGQAPRPGAHQDASLPTPL